VGLFSVPENVWERYARRDIDHFEYHTHQRVHVSADGMPVSVDFDRYGQLRHYGLANLPAEMRVAVREGRVSETVATVQPEAPAAAPPPTVLHVTHWKAGSQWIHKILNAIAPERVIAPRSDMAQFLVKPMRAGGVYPTLYVTRSEYERVEPAGDVRRVVMIRDLRDTLVSGYFSLRGSHPVIGPEIASHRTRLKDGNVEEGLINLMDLWLPGCARIQASWLEAGEPVLKYEDLLADDVGMLLPLLRDRLGFAEVPVETLMAAIEAARFDRLTGGRVRGDEDVASHERKGIAGDWRNHFTPRVKRAFKLRYGALLIEAGYEKDFDW
jgi:lipopolysaccharide transport system ATP-binding protein